jgi:antitoxin (DNA-binding transcriptional repressor) of toxin-antitoxin stability system
MMYNVIRTPHTIESRRCVFMSITATELKMNLGKYLMLAETEDVFITKNGKVIAKLTNPNADRVEMARSLFGVIPADVTVEEARDERLDNI